MPTIHELKFSLYRCPTMRKLFSEVFIVIYVFQMKNISHVSTFQYILYCYL